VVGSMVASIYPTMVFVKSNIVLEKAQIVTLGGLAGAG
jgi:hypothetical protein